MDVDNYARLAALRMSFVMLVEMLSRDGKVSTVSMSGVLEDFLSSLSRAANEGEIEAAMRDEMNAIIKALRMSGASAAYVSRTH
jgi:hypothetical protein